MADPTREEFELLIRAHEIPSTALVRKRVTGKSTPTLTAASRAQRLGEFLVGAMREAAATIRKQRPDDGVYISDKWANAIRTACDQKTQEQLALISPEPEPPAPESAENKFARAIRKAAPRSTRVPPKWIREQRAQMERRMRGGGGNESR